jgi:trehalose-6-phosphate synthase
VRPLHLALTMSPTEQRARMHSVRGIVQEFNVYRWARRMLMDAARCGNEPASSAKWERDRRKRPQGTQHDTFAI